LSQTTKQTHQQRYYLLIGDQQNWKISLDKKIWGFSSRAKGSWNTTKKGDLLAFYITRPIQKIIGFGIVTDKFVGDTIIWSDEKLLRKPFWKYRIKFQIIHFIDDWDDGIILPKDLLLGVSRRVIGREFFINLVKVADAKWKTKLSKRPELMF